MITSNNPTPPLSRAPWADRLADLDEFVRQNGRFPSKTSDGPERSLATWLANQRQTHQNGALSEARQAALDTTLTSWKGRDHDAAWETHLNDVTAWRADRGRWPSAAGDNAEESRIGAWLAVQRTIAVRGTATAERIVKLDALLPDWSSVTIFDDNWTASLNAMAEYKAHHGRLPRQSATDAEVKLLAVWMSRQRSRAKDGTLTIARRAQLNELIVGWDWTAGNRGPNH